MEAKQPQFFVEMTKEVLQPSRYVLADNVGVAAGLAWSLKRDDIILYGQMGELKYGLNYPDARGRFVSQTGFPDWLAQHRRGYYYAGAVDFEGSGYNSTCHSPADYVNNQGRLVLIQYRPQ